jgi:hypothetical protein
MVRLSRRRSTLGRVGDRSPLRFGTMNSPTCEPCLGASGKVRSCRTNAGTWNSRRRTICASRISRHSVGSSVRTACSTRRPEFVSWMALCYDSCYGGGLSLGRRHSVAPLFAPAAERVEEVVVGGGHLQQNQTGVELPLDVLKPSPNTPLLGAHLREEGSRNRVPVSRSSTQRRDPSPGGRATLRRRRRDHGLERGHRRPDGEALRPHRRIHSTAGDGRT